MADRSRCKAAAKQDCVAQLKDTEKVKAGTAGGAESKKRQKTDESSDKEVAG